MSGYRNAAAAGNSGGAALTYSGTVTVGQVAISPGKGAPTITQRGYADATRSITGGAFGARSPTTVNGFTIVGLYFESVSDGSSAQTSLVVTGDSSARGANLAVNGHAQSLGAGIYSGGPNTTTYKSPAIISDPFGATSSTATVTMT